MTYIKPSLQSSQKQPNCCCYGTYDVHYGRYFALEQIIYLLAKNHVSLNVKISLFFADFADILR